jgi:hypothetical protein
VGVVRSERARSRVRASLLAALAGCSSAVLWIAPISALLLAGIVDEYGHRVVLVFASFAFTLGAATGYLRVRKRVTASTAALTWTLAIVVSLLGDPSLRIVPLLVVSAISVMVGRVLGTSVRRLNELVQWQGLVARAPWLRAAQTVPDLPVPRKLGALADVPDSQRPLVARVRARRPLR